ncbi:hypothetical protein ABW20_dc0109690 [Dactylellina cionopaga]|nr:hypothetical protein ABW20_dc0109690 [Dactylellina cionopaga]
MAVHPSSVEPPAYDDDYYDAAAPDPDSVTRLASKHTTEGYRDGITASKQQHIQEGFDEGYILGAALGLKVGEILGVLDGIVGTLNGLLLSSEKDAKATKGGEGLKELLEGQKRVRENAKEELALEKVFGREYFGEDGIWRWNAENDGADLESKTFDDIVLQHPLVVKWSEIVERQSKELGLVFEEDAKLEDNGEPDDS